MTTHLSDRYKKLGFLDVGRAFIKSGEEPCRKPRRTWGVLKQNFIFSCNGVDGMTNGGCLGSIRVASGNHLVEHRQDVVIFRVEACRVGLGTY